MTYKDIKAEKYFTTVALDKKCIEIMSNNTGHMWKIEDFRIGYDLFHSYSIIDKYHYQTAFGSLIDVIDYIKEHDMFQLGGRKRSRKKPSYALNI